MIMYIVPITTVTLATQVLQVALLASLASATAPLLACMSGPTLAALSWCTGPSSSHLRGRLYSVDWTRDWTVGLDCGTGLWDWTEGLDSQKVALIRFRSSTHTLLHYSILTSRELNSGQTAITRQTKFQQPFLPMGVLYKYVLQAK